MKAYIFPGQGAQFPGMGKDLFENSKTAHDLFNIANEILGFRISDIMFDGSAEDLKETSVTQPAIFLHSVILALSKENGILPEMVAGHSLGEFSALVVNKSISFEDGLKLVSIRANAMQKACENNPGTMAAVLGLEDNIVEKMVEGRINKFYQEVCLYNQISVFFHVHSFSNKSYRCYHTYLHCVFSHNHLHDIHLNFPLLID